MMTIWRGIGAQLRDPTGAAGRAMGHAMRLVNARPNALAVAALRLGGGEEILELGCGPGHAAALVAAMAPVGTVHAVDRSGTMLAQAAARNRQAVRAGRVRLYRAGFDALPFADRSMDGVLAVNVAYFWFDAAPVLAEVRRVLRPGGRLVVYVTEAAAMRRWKFADSHSHRLYDQESLATMLRQGGFAAPALARVTVFPGVAGLIATASPAPGPASPAWPVAGACPRLSSRPLAGKGIGGT